MGITFLEEKEFDFIDSKNEMELLPWQFDVSVNKWSEQIAKIIKRRLAEEDPIRRRFASELAINELATELAKLSGKYRIAIMPYSMIRQALKYQSYRLVAVGEIKMDGYFAVIDENARMIGVYIPKSPRQIDIEHVIHDALSDLACRLCSKGGKLAPYVREALRNFMWKQRYSENVKPVKIAGTRHEISESVTEELLQNGRIIQMQFKKNENVLYYHIK